MGNNVNLHGKINGVEVIGSHKVSKTFWYDGSGRHVADKHNYIWKDKKSGERVLWGYIVPDTKEFYCRSSALLGMICGSASLEAELDDEGVYDFERTYYLIKGVYNYEMARDILTTSSTGKLDNPV